MEMNPYAPPVYDLAPDAPPPGDGSFIEGGRGVEAGRGYAWLTEGWAIVKVNFWSWFLVIILYGALAIGVSLVPVVGQVVFSAVTPLLTAGLLIGCRDIQERRDFGVGHLFEGFKHAGGLLVIGLVHLAWSLVLGGVGLAVGGGGMFNAKPQFNPATGFDLAVLQPLLLFAVVSFVIGVPVTMATYYAPALVALRGMSPIDAMKNSLLGASKNVLPFIVYCLATFLFAILATLPCGLGVFVLAPVLIASVYAGYRDVFFMDPAPPSR